MSAPLQDDILEEFDNLVEDAKRAYAKAVEERDRTYRELNRQVYAAKVALQAMQAVQDKLDDERFMNYTQPRSE